MILTHDHILEEMEKKNILIEPLTSNDQIGPASIDIHLGNLFRRFKTRKAALPVREDTNFKEITDYVEIGKDDHLTLEPGEMILGITWEKITLSESIAGWIEGRSRFARLGLAVHITSGFIQPGIANHQVLEIANLSPAPLALYPGVRICQIVFERCEGTARYKGLFQGQDKP
ncbi:MAG: dCTP deaminase [Patescibacteria group bacterium]|nr:MAG: dCTP deaminase [Patescibacteria group bacterium]